MSHEIEYVEPDDRPIKKLIVRSTFQSDSPRSANSLKIEIGETGNPHISFKGWGESADFIYGLYPSRTDIDAIIKTLQQMRDRA